MYNFQNVNDYEFEVICKDILEVYTGKEFKTYAKGPDGGIDIKAVINEKDIGQAKHYTSSTSALVSSLRIEFVKVRKLNPDKYYLFTSKSLTASKIDEIYSIFEKYMPSKNYIFDGTRLNNLLDKEEYKDVVRKHIKLWMVSSNVMDIVMNHDVYIDSEYVFDEIEKESELYVETSNYQKALKVLKDEQVVLLEGNPGVGKTILSKMLILFYVSKGYKIKYSTSDSVSDLKNAVSMDKTTKEIVFLDDFLGQHYLNIKEDRANEIKALVSYIKKSSSKKLILNSRITILGEASRKHRAFRVLLEDNHEVIHMISVDNMSDIEKARILYNHLYFKKIPEEYFNQLVIAERYMNIIKNKNYNPRIIEYITSRKIIKDINPENYYDYVMQKLNKPNEIWSDEFYDRISIVDRIFMLTLYSLTNIRVNEVILKNAFHKRISKEKTIDLTIDHYSQCLYRLSNSMITVYIDESLGNRRIGVVNPSVNDFIKSVLEDNGQMVDEMIRYAYYYEQIKRLYELFRKDECISIDDEHATIDYLGQNSFYYPMEYYYLKGVYDGLIEPKVDDAIIHELLVKKSTYRMLDSNTNTNAYYVNLGCLIAKNFFMDKEQVKKYSLDKVMFEEGYLYELISLLNYDTLLNLISFFKSLENDLNLADRITEEFRNKLEYIVNNHCEYEIESKVHEILEENYGEIVGDIINDLDNEIKVDYQSELNSVLDDVVNDAVKIEIEALIDEKHIELGCGFIEINTEASSESILDDLDIDGEISNYFSVYEDYDEDYYPGFQSSDVRSADFEIHRLFSKE